MWEDVEKGVFRKNKRIRTILKFENVISVLSKGINQKKRSRFLDHVFFVFILDKIGKEIVPKAIIIAIAAEILAKISGKSSVQIANNNNNDNKFIDDIVNLCVIVINIFKGFTININNI